MSQKTVLTVLGSSECNSRSSGAKILKREGEFLRKFHQLILDCETKLCYFDPYTNEIFMQPGTHEEFLEAYIEVFVTNPSPVRRKEWANFLRKLGGYGFDKIIGGDKSRIAAIWHPLFTRQAVQHSHVPDCKGVWKAAGKAAKHSWGPSPDWEKLCYVQTSQNTEPLEEVHSLVVDESDKENVVPTVCHRQPLCTAGNKVVMGGNSNTRLSHLPEPFMDVCHTEVVELFDVPQPPENLCYDVGEDLSEPSAQLC